MKLVVAMASAALACVAGQDALARSYDEIMEEAQEAFAADDIAAASTLLDEAQNLRPYSLYLTRNRVLARVLTGRMDDAVALAAEVAERGIVLETPPHEAFDRLKAAPAYAPVAARMETNARPIGEAHVIFESDRIDLLPEAIARRKDAILIGSVRTGAIFEISNGLMREIARGQSLVAAAPASGGQKAPEASLDRALRILLAEDNQINAVLATTLMRRAGHKVDVAANGEEAVRAATAVAYDLIFMDMHMPILDGLEASRRIRALPGVAALTPIIALTANAMSADRQKCLAAGMNDFLSKPFDPGDLHTMLVKWAAPTALDAAS